MKDEMIMLKILVVGKIFSKEDVKPLENIGKCTFSVPKSLLFARPGRIPTVIETTEDADVVILSHQTKLAKQAITKNKNLRMISVCSSGYDNVNVDVATRQGIAVTNVPEYGSTAVAEYVFGLLLCLVRKIIQADKETRHGTWDAHVRVTRFVGKELQGKTIGVIGMGNVGGRVAKIAQGFGLKVLAWTRNPSIERARRSGVEFVDLQTLLETSDFVSVHVPLTKDTSNMISDGEIGMMKEGAILINTARGGIVNEEALVQALKNGKLGGACVDVFSEEPIRRNNPLLKTDNVIVSPHVAFCTEASLKKLVQTSISNVINFVNDNPQNIVNPEYMQHIKSA